MPTKKKPKPTKDQIDAACQCLEALGFPRNARMLRDRVATHEAYERGDSYDQMKASIGMKSLGHITALRKLGLLSTRNLKTIDLDEVRRLIGEGLTNAEIGLRLGKLPGAIATVASNNSLHGRKGRGVNKTRVSKIVRWTEEGRTLQWIGNKLGITKERVRQIILAYEHTHGAKVERGPAGYFAKNTVAQRLGVSHSTVRAMTVGGKVRTVQTRHATLINLEDAKANLSGRVCVICGKTGKWRATQSTCGEPACRQEKGRRLRNKNLAKPPEGGLWATIKKSIHDNPSPNGQWLRSREMSRRSGFTQVQLWYMAQREIIRTKKTPQLGDAMNRVPVLFCEADVMKAAELHKKLKPKPAEKSP